MIRNYLQGRNPSFRDKIVALDFKLIFLILLLGIISLFAMYSSERGDFSYHTQSHLYRFSIFLFFQRFFLFLFKLFLLFPFQILLNNLIILFPHFLNSCLSKTFFITFLAIGAAPELPEPPCSTTTLIAYLGFL